MSEFKSGSGSDLSIRIRVVRIFESFWVRTNSDNRTTGFGHRTIRFLCNFGPNSLEKFINTTSNNRVRVRSYRISVVMFKNYITYSDIRTIGSGHRTSGFRSRSSQNVLFIIRTGFGCEVFVRCPICPNPNWSKPEFLPPLNDEKIMEVFKIVILVYSYMFIEL